MGVMLILLGSMQMKLLFQVVETGFIDKPYLLIILYNLVVRFRLTGL